MIPGFSKFLCKVKPCVIVHRAIGGGTDVVGHDPKVRFWGATLLQGGVRCKRLATPLSFRSGSQ